MAVPSWGQEDIQWANKVISYSSQFQENEYSAKQALGLPNALGAQNKEEMAWVPKKETNVSGEYIEVAFAKAIRVKQVAIGESKNPGSISKIFLIDTGGKKHLVYENKTPRNILQPFRLFRHNFAKTNYLVSGLRLEMKTKAAAGSNQIDAIAISDSSIPIRSKINQVSYASDLPRPERLSTTVNSQYSERLPIISPDGNTLFFARKDHPQNVGDNDYDDIWVATKSRTGDWGYATNVGSPLNDKQHNFSVAFNPTGDMLYLANDYRSNKKDGLSYSRKKGRTWSMPVTMIIEDLYNESDFVSYHVSQDGAYLLMAVQRKEGYGDRDIYVSFREDQISWSKPRNLGATINTVSMESGAFLAADGKTLYFSSNGHAGFGGLDMFVSKRLDKTWTNWSTPQNIGEGINTPNNEYNYTIAAKGDYAYFASDDVKGSSDLYRIKLPEEMRPEPVVLYSGNIIDSETNEQIKEAKLKINSLKTSKSKSSLVSLGNYQIAMPYGEDLEVYADINGYYTVSQRLYLSGEELEELDFDERALTSNSSTVNSDELDALKAKIAKLNTEIERLDDQRSKQNNLTGLSKRKSSGDKELNDLRRKYQASQGNEEIAEQTSKKSSGDKELDNLRDRLNEYKEEETENIGDLPKTTTSKDDQALDEMKRRYRQYFEEESTEDVAEETVVDNSAEEANFEFIKEKIKTELEADMLPDVLKELEIERKPVAVQAVKETLSKEELIVANDPQTILLLNERLKENPLVANMPIVTKAKFRSLDASIEKDLRKQLKVNVDNSIREQYGPLMEKHIMQEFSYLVKKEVEANLQFLLLAELEKNSAAKEERPKQKVVEKPKPLVKKYKEETVDLIAIPLEKGQTIPLNNIFFEANKSNLQDISATELNRVHAFLKAYSNMKVEIGGHTNGWCSHEYANELSKERAEEVANYFVGLGIPKDRIQYKGYGKTKPVASNDTSVGRKKNQRVELKILSM